MCIRDSICTDRPPSASRRAAPASGAPPPHFQWPGLPLAPGQSVGGSGRALLCPNGRRDGGRR
eukprot:9369754-Alexandrium_andersonii.AAC.1